MYVHTHGSSDSQMHTLMLLHRTKHISFVTSRVELNVWYEYATSKNNSQQEEQI